MAEMTSHERFKRMFEHREADRVPIIDMPWDSTIERWKREGMPEDADWVEYFGVDHMAHIFPDTSPRYEEKVLEETEEYRIHTTRWGATMKDFKHGASTPGFLDFTITDPDKWQEAKRRMTPTADRIDWDYLKANYKTWREQGYWILGELWFGFDAAHSWAVGTERLLMALIEKPEWCVDMFNHFLDVSIALMDMIWDAGFEFDVVAWADDLGYKHNQFFSVETYRELLKPVHKRAVEWARAKGVHTYLHSCGDVNPFIPEFIEIGIEGLNPLEVKAGMDPVAIKKQYGDDLLLYGGNNILLWDDIDAIEQEMRKILPVVKQGGGYIFSSDHSVPSSVSLENFRRIVELAKELGAY
ncbi:MAG: hypothetical protein KAV00_12660 [Phycisphaerae bacterium]|nr:hypothetical protein [Phycisphaerae bacterium]